MKTKYDYHSAMRLDIQQYMIDNGIYNDAAIISADYYDLLDDEDAYEMYDRLYNEMFISDSITGNASGSYFCNAWKAEEAICHNLDLLKWAAKDSGYNVFDLLDRGAEFCDVLIRCEILGEVLYQVMADQGFAL